jgi:hypothetical protein
MSRVRFFLIVIFGVSCALSVSILLKSAGETDVWETNSNGTQLLQYTVSCGNALGSGNATYTLDPGETITGSNFGVAPGGMETMGDGGMVQTYSNDIQSQCSHTVLVHRWQAFAVSPIGIVVILWLFWLLMVSLGSSLGGGG